MVQHTFISVLLLLLLLLCLLWLGNKKFCNNAAHERPLVFCLALCLIACAVSSCACVCGWFLIEVTSKNLLDDLFFCDNRVMAKRTTLLTVVFRVMKSILRPSEGRLLRCFTHMIGLMLSSVALLGYSVLCHLACMAHHVLAKVSCLLVLFPSSLLLDCISWCILIALRSVGFVSL